MNNLFSINILTWNSERYIKKCLESVFAQTYKNIEVNIFDNGSCDETIDLLKGIQNRQNSFPVRLFFSDKNVGFSAGHNRLIRESKGEFVLVLNHDVVLDDNFAQKAVEALINNKDIGSIQAKIYQLNDGKKTNIIDTVGFSVYRSGRIIDEGQGSEDKGQYGQEKEIFGANGAAPIYRRTAFFDVELTNKAGQEEYFDEDFFSYAEDADLAWRIRWRGWKCVFCPGVKAWHDRTTSKRQKKNYFDFIRHRKTQSAWARRIGWRNQWLVFIKNLPTLSFIKFLPWFFWRQFQLVFYLILFEQKTLLAIPEIIALIPKTIKKRRFILGNKKVANREMERWFK